MLRSRANHVANTGCAHTIPVKRRGAGKPRERGPEGKGGWGKEGGG